MFDSIVEKLEGSIAPAHASAGSPLAERAWPL